MRAYALRFDNSIIDLRLRDLSYDGCTVETTEALIPGELLKLSVLERGFVRATVRWYKDRKAGLQFDPERQEREHRQRKADRVQITAQFLFEDQPGRFIRFSLPTLPDLVASASLWNGRKLLNGSG
jgi:hypothetical protein